MIEEEEHTKKSHKTTQLSGLAMNNSGLKSNC